MISWLLPTLGYVVVAGVFGVVQKLALRQMTWQEVFLWLPVSYVIVATVLALSGTRVYIGAGWGWAAATSLLGVAGLVLFSIALSNGDVSVIVPFSSIYILVTALVSIVLLSERLTMGRTIGTGLIVAGIVLLSR